MKITKTYKFKIKDPNPGKVESLLRLASCYRRGLNFCLEMAKEKKLKDPSDLHPYVYSHLRKTLPSQLALSCRDKALEVYKSYLELKRDDSVHRKFPHFNKLPAIRFNIPRSLSLCYLPDKDQYWISVLTLAGRINLQITGKKKTLKKVISSHPTHAEIVFKEDSLYLHVALSTKIEKPELLKCKTFIGVDLNATGHLIFAAAQDIEGRILDTFSTPAGYFNWKRKHFNEIRRSLQKAKKLKKVKSLKQKERNFVNSFLQRTTTEFINWAKKFESPFLSLEDLKNIRAKVKYSKILNRKIHSWPFRSGQDNLKYKGLAQGFFIKTLSGAFSSRYCSFCGSKNTRRSGATLFCKTCGYGLNAHLQGARNMSWRAIRYYLVAAGRAGDKTAERQSGPKAVGVDRETVSLYNRPLDLTSGARLQASEFIPG